MRTRSPTIGVGAPGRPDRGRRVRGEREARLDPCLGHLVEDDDHRSAMTPNTTHRMPRRDLGATWRVRSSPGRPLPSRSRAARCARCRRRAGTSRPGRPVGRRARARCRRRACRAATPRGAAPARPRPRPPSSQTSIRASERQLAPASQVLEARVSSRASPSARRSSVRVVSMTTTMPSSSATAVPGRGVARISTSSAASSWPAEPDRAVRAGTRPRWRVRRP